MMQFSLRKQQGPSWQLDITATLPEGKITAITGASGAGKSTLLRLIAGLEQADAGYIRLGQTEWLSTQVHLPPQQRNIGMMFQDYALFPHMSVRQNVSYGAKPGDEAWVSHLIAQSGLDALQHRRPDALSGGQRQRVALIRALARRPKVLLLDEPLSALDPALRKQLQGDLLHWQQTLGITTLLVTHDLTEVFLLAEHVLKLSQGQLLHQGTPHEVYASTHRGVHNQLPLQAVVLAKAPADLLWRITVQCGGAVTDMLLTSQEARHLAVGDTLPLLAGNLTPLPTQPERPS